MRTASIADLKARLSEFMAAAKRGEEVLITDRGRPVARLIPMINGEVVDAGMQELVRAGLVREPRERLKPSFWKTARPADAEGNSLDVVREEREDSW